MEGEREQGERGPPEAYLRLQSGTRQTKLQLKNAILSSPLMFISTTIRRNFLSQREGEKEGERERTVTVEEQIVAN